MAGNWLTRMFRRSRVSEQRSIQSLPWNYGGFGSSYMSMDTATQFVPLFGCVRILSDSIASLPLKAYRAVGDQRIPLENPPALLAHPATRDDLFSWVHKGIVSLALKGNAYGLILERDGWGYPTTIEWLHPDDVFVDETNPLMPAYYHQGVKLRTADVFHIPWITYPGRVEGVSPIKAHMGLINTGLQSSSYGKAWFESGGMPSFVLKNNEHELNPEQVQQIYEDLIRRSRAGDPLVIGAAWDLKPISVNPDEAQFIETQRLTASQVATIFGIPPDMVGGEVGGSMTYSNTEQQAINFVQFTLRPWLTRLERHISAVLPEKTYVKFNAGSLLRTDLKTRYEAHRLGLASGFLSVNEVRKLEDLSPIPGGDEYRPIQQIQEPPSGKNSGDDNDNDQEADRG